MKKKICVVVNNRANYARIKSLLIEITKIKKFDLNILLGASAILTRFGNVDKIIKSDGLKISGKIYSIVEGENLATMSKSTGLAIIETTTYFENIRPDVVIVIADRFENLSVAIAASYLNIPLIHIQGGEVTGSIDEKVRHAITKLSDIHFVSNSRAKKFLINMGENKEKIFITGCPSIDLVKGNTKSLDKNFFIRNMGIGNTPSFNEKYMVFLQHPETTKFDSVKAQINETIRTAKSFNKIKIVWLWPNIDAGSDIISKELRKIREKDGFKNISFHKNFSPEDYIRLIYNSKCLVGNSSSGIREASFLGIPVVNIGTRQKDRERSNNIIDVPYKYQKIRKAINKQLEKKKYLKSSLYGNGIAGKKISKILNKLLINKISTEKRLNYL